MPDSNARGDRAALAAQRFLELASARQGHFRLESGHHSELWFDLSGLFTDVERIAAFVTALANRLRPHTPEAVCGPLTGGAFLAQLIAVELAIPFLFTERIAPEQPAHMYPVRYVLQRSAAARVRHQRVAIVDDVMSAGSALRGTYGTLRGHGARVVVAGALMILGDVGAEFFGNEGMPLESVFTQPFNIWAPDECPLCQASITIEDAPC